MFLELKKVLSPFNNSIKDFTPWLISYKVLNSTIKLLVEYSHIRGFYADNINTNYRHYSINFCLWKCYLLPTCYIKALCFYLLVYPVNYIRAIRINFKFIKVFQLLPFSLLSLSTPRIYSKYRVVRICLIWHLSLFSE